MGLEVKTCLQALLLMPPHSQKPPASWQPRYQWSKKDWVESPWQGNHQQQPQFPQRVSWCGIALGSGEAGLMDDFFAWEDESAWRKPTLKYKSESFLYLIYLLLQETSKRNTFLEALRFLVVSIVHLKVSCLKLGNLNQSSVMYQTWRYKDEQLLLGEEPDS